MSFLAYKFLNVPAIHNFIKDQPDGTPVIILNFEGFNGPFVIGTPDYEIEVKPEGTKSISELKPGMTAMGPDRIMFKIKEISHWMVSSLGNDKLLLREN